MTQTEMDIDDPDRPADAGGEGPPGDGVRLLAHLPGRAARHRTASWWPTVPHGLRMQPDAADHVGIGGSLPATCFPTASGLASSWDRDLLADVGHALAHEARVQGVSVILGPGVNMKRSPLCGRNFEYFSEDPYLAGELALAMVAAIQEQGVGTSLKHFAANNQEDDRLRVSAEVDERTLREIYLPAFERVVTGGAAVDGHVRLQQGQRHLRLRAPLAAHRGAARRVGLRGARRLRLGSGPRPGGCARCRARPGDAAGEEPQRARRGRGGHARVRCRSRCSTRVYAGCCASSSSPHPPLPRHRPEPAYDEHHALARRAAAAVGRAAQERRRAAAAA